MFNIPSVIWTTVLLTLLAAWLVVSLVNAWQRLSRARQLLADEQIESARAALDEPKWLEGAGWLVAFLIVMSVFTGMQEGKDLTLTLVSATLILGLIRLLDVLVLAKPRKQLKAYPLDETLSQQVTYASKVLSWGRDYFVIILIVLIIRSWVFEPFKIPSASMRPTLIEGDYLVVSRFSYGIYLPVLNRELLDLGDPQRGDVIVFTPPHQPSRYIKRVIGVPGDHIRYDSATKQLYVNDQRISRTLVPGGASTLEMVRESGATVEARLLRYQEDLLGVEHDIYLRPNSGSPLTGVRNFDATLAQVNRGIVIPEGKYFAMGDNRDASLDSRYWGLVDESMIAGKAEFKWMHWPSLFSVPKFHRVGAIE